MKKGNISPHKGRGGKSIDEKGTTDVGMLDLSAGSSIKNLGGGGIDTETVEVTVRVFHW